MFDEIEGKIQYIKIVIPETGEYYESKKYQPGEDITFIHVETMERVHLEPHRDVNFCCVTQDALYQAKTQLVSLQHSGYITTFTVKTPKTLEKQQRRKCFRVNIDQEAAITYDDETGDMKTVSCRTCNLSTGGVKLTLKEAIEIPENVTLDIIFDKRIIETEAKLVRYCNDGKNPQVAFEFLGLDGESTDVIASVCFKKQLEDIKAKKKSL